mmetsp:Transcript_26167/g.61476  ORF Transcript_26167/g.61476 Transcript_26167/m.61476 type:complete len:81 (-) Transcript_26167:1267-1509(-)
MFSFRVDPEANCQSCRVSTANVASKQSDLSWSKGESQSNPSVGSSEISPARTSKVESNSAAASTEISFEMASTSSSSSSS